MKQMLFYIGIGIISIIIIPLWFIGAMLGPLVMPIVHGLKDGDEAFDRAIDKFKNWAGS